MIPTFLCDATRHFPWKDCLTNLKQARSDGGKRSSKILCAKIIPSLAFIRFKQSMDKLYSKLQNSEAMRRQIKFKPKI